jgi:phosphopantothenoylcysteine decarboxylase/phosphopantothenate--cysteine ligase
LGKRVLLIISGGIAAVKCPDLIRCLTTTGIATRCILTRSGAEFVTPLSLATLSGDKVYGDPFSLTDESQMGHIELSRSADLVLVIPATAHILARMASGLADDLATTALLATDKPVMVAPAMNVRMWEHAATIQNLNTLRQRGVMVIGPEEGEMACGEHGFGRMSEPEDIVKEVENYFRQGNRLSGKRALVTSGPTFEAIDPVRYISNRSSGKQGHDIANALARLGAETTLVSGPSNEPNPSGVSVVRVQSARDMLTACKGALPADIVVCAAAVSDWRTSKQSQLKLKKNGSDTAVLELTLNPDILETLSKPSNKRPSLVVGFSAETDDIIAHATQKRMSKGCDWIVANDVSIGTDTFGGAYNTIHLITADGLENWPKMSKPKVARKLALRIADALDQIAER